MHVEGFLVKLPLPLPWEIVSADISQYQAGDVPKACVGLPYGG